MNKRQLLQHYQNIWEKQGKLSKRQYNKVIYGLKLLDSLERELEAVILKRLSKQKHMYSIRTKTRANNDYNEQIKTLEAQCGYKYDIFNFVTLNRQCKKQAGRVSTPQARKDKPAVKVIKNKKQSNPKTFKQAFKDLQKLEIIKQASR